MFFPLLQAYVQREFEVVLTLAFAAALWCLIENRRSRAALLLAYAAWFKYIPLMSAGYLFVRRWWRPLAVFAVVSAAILAASHVLFDLSRFFNNNVPGHAAQVFQLWTFEFRYDATGHRYGLGFCEGWTDNESTLPTFDMDCAHLPPPTPGSIHPGPTTRSVSWSPACTCGPISPSSGAC